DGPIRRPAQEVVRTVLVRASLLLRRAAECLRSECVLDACQGDSREDLMGLFLVTGGAGFIGSHLCASLLAHGHAVRVLDDLSSGTRGNLPAGVELIEGDIADPEVAAAALAGAAGC